MTDWVKEEAERQAKLSGYSVLKQARLRPVLESCIRAGLREAARTCELWQQQNDFSRYGSASGAMVLDTLGKHLRALAGASDARPDSATTTARFPETYCSQCGGEFGPGNAGYSHCIDHGGVPPEGVR